MAKQSTVATRQRCKRSWLHARCWSRRLSVRTRWRLRQLQQRPLWRESVGRQGLPANVQGRAEIGRRQSETPPRKAPAPSPRVGPPVVRLLAIRAHRSKLAEPGRNWSGISASRSEEAVRCRRRAVRCMLRRRSPGPPYANALYRVAVLELCNHATGTREVTSVLSRGFVGSRPRGFPGSHQRSWSTRTVSGPCSRR